MAGLCLVAALFALDAPTGAWLTADPTRRVVQQIAKIPVSAEFYIVIAAILACYANRVRLWVGFFLPVLLTTAILHLLKWAVGRARPLLELGAYTFQPFSGEKGFDAFPSGHAAGAATLALLLGIYFPRARWAFYVLALCVGLLRIVEHWHWPSDVVAGFTLAVVSVHLSTRLLGPRYYQKKSSDALAEVEPPASTTN